MDDNSDIAGWLESQFTFGLESVAYMEGTRAMAEEAETIRNAALAVGADELTADRIGMSGPPPAWVLGEAEPPSPGVVQACSIGMEMLRAAEKQGANAAQILRDMREFYMSELAPER